MKKYIFILSAFVFVLLLPGCEKEFDGLVEPGSSSYKINSVNSFSSVYYGLQDSVIQLMVTFSDDNGISNIYCEVTGADGEVLAGSPVSLYDNGSADNSDASAGDKIYSGNITLKQTDPNGQYSIDYYVTDFFSGTNLVASQYFNYDNGQAIFPPVVSNLVAPDTVTLDPANDTFIPLSLDVADENGLNDIKKVFFNSYKPDGNITGSSPIEMYDDGNMASHGDLTEKDGVYSLIVRMPSEGVAKGTYRWEFQAIDRRGLLSEKIIHNLVVK